MTARSSESSRSRRAVRIAWIVAGIETSVRSRLCHPAVLAVDEETLVDQHPQALLDEKWIPLGELGYARARLAGELRAPDETTDQLVGVRARERLDRQDRRVRLACRPRGTHLEQLRPRQAEDQHWRRGDPVREVLDEVEERRLAPLDVVEDDHERSVTGDMLEQLPHRPERLLDRDLVTRPEQRSEALGDESAVRRRLDRTGKLGRRLGGRIALSHRGDVPERADQRPERDPLTVGEATATRDRRASCDLADQLIAEPGLSDPGGADRGDDPRRPCGRRPLEVLCEHPQLLLTVDQGGVEAAQVAGGAGVDLEEAPRGNGARLALQTEALDRLGVDGRMREAVRRLAQQDLPGLGCLLEAGRDVDSVAGHEALVEAGLAGDDLSGVDPDPRRDPHSDRALEVVVEAIQGDPHVRCRADRAQGVVFVDLRDAEHRHHGVADVLLDDAAVKRDDTCHLVEVPEHQMPDGLRVERLCERCRVRDVAEQHGDRLAELALSSAVRPQWHAAGRAEAGAAFNAGAARCAGCGDVAHRGPHVPLPSERAAAPDRSLQL